VWLAKPAYPATQLSQGTHSYNLTVVLKLFTDGLAESNASINPLASKLKIIIISHLDNYIKVAFKKNPRVKNLSPSLLIVKSIIIRLRAKDKANNIRNNIIRVIKF